MCALQRPLDDQTQLRLKLEAVAVLSILEHCRTGGAELVSSDALTFETNQNPHPDRRTFAETVLADAGVHQPLTPAVQSRAMVLEAGEMKPLDALHVASAEAAGAVYFCTCDDRLLRRARVAVTPPLRAMSPLELTTELNL